MTELLPVAADQRVAPDLAALRGAVAAILEQGRTVNIVYAPTSVTHHHAAAPTAVALPVARPYRGGGGHPGIDVDLTGYGYGGFVLPHDPGPMPTVAEQREFAPLVLLISLWSGFGALAVSVLTSNLLAIAGTILAGAVALLAYMVNHRNMWGR